MRITKDNILTAIYTYVADQPGDSPSSYTKTSIKVTCTGHTLTHIVPLDTDNTDYNTLMEWVAEGNTITDNNPNP